MNHDDVGVAPRSKYITRKLRKDPLFIEACAEFDGLAATLSSTDQRDLLRWAVSLYQDALNDRLKYAERVKRVLRRTGNGGDIDGEDPGLDASSDDVSVSAGIATVPIFGAAYARARESEARSAAVVEHVVRRHPTWPWLSGISGIGPIVAARLLARLDVRRAATPSAFWAYCGLATVPGNVYRCRTCGVSVAGIAGLTTMPAHRRPGGQLCTSTAAGPGESHDSHIARVAQPRPRKGESRAYDATARHACYLIGISFARQGTSYKALYLKRREYFEQQHPEWTPKRIVLAAQRAAVKRFLVDLWTEWRRIEDLPVVPPYALRGSRRLRSRIRSSSAQHESDGAVSEDIAPRPADIDSTAEGSRSAVVAPTQSKSEKKEKKPRNGVSAAPRGRARAATTSTQVDKDAIRSIAARFLVLSDAKDWRTVRALLVDGEVECELGPLAGGFSGRMSADQFVRGFVERLHAGKRTMHQIRVATVVIDDQRATLVGKGSAWHQVPGVAHRADLRGADMWETWGTWSIEFARTAAGWRVCGIRYAAAYSRGNADVTAHR